MHDERLDRRQRDLIANLLDDLGRIVRVAFLELVARRIVVLASLELLHRLHHRVVIARHPDRRCRFERVHDADHVGRPDLRVEEARQRIAHREARAAPHVVVVEEDREQPDVVARRFRFFVVIGADLAHGLLRRLDEAAVEPYQLERVDRLRLPVFEHVEVARLQVGHAVAALVFRDDDVDPDVVDAGPEDWRLRRLIRRRRRLLLRLLRLLLRLLAGGALKRRDRDQRGGESGRPEETGHISILDRQV